MMRWADHDSRRKEILTAVIELYLNLVQPVSSETVLREKDVALSSATVRNVFAELEEIGLLTHPHTSAGRVPTDEGYRFYINRLMKKKDLSSDETSFIDKIYELKVKEREDLLSETSKIMSDLTHYVSIVYLDEEDKFYSQGMRFILEHPEFQDARLAYMVLEALEKKDELVDLISRSFEDQTHVFIGKECDCPQMECCSVVVSRYKQDDEHRGRLALIGPRRMNYETVIPLMDYISEAVARHIERF
jgi:transcriptional regulator of heat shock response